MLVYLIIIGIIILDIIAIADVLRNRIINGWAYITLIAALPFLGFTIWYLRKTIDNVHSLKTDCSKCNGYSINRGALNDTSPEDLKNKTLSEIKGKTFNIDDSSLHLSILRNNLVVCHRAFKESNDYYLLTEKIDELNTTEAKHIIYQIESQYHDLFDGLSVSLGKREILICILASLGIKDKSIASLLFVSNTTVRAHKSKIKKKLSNSCYSLFFTDKLSGNIHSKVKSILYILILISIGCTNKDYHLHQALDFAGSNRSELESLLNHYKDNPEKLAAARFLIENMPPHRSYQGDEIHQYYEIARSVLASDLTPVQQRDSLLHVCDDMFPGLDDRTVSDIRVIKADFLIRSIDQAFDDWKNRPWARHLTFDEFCEWLLPYKAVELQEMDSWRDTLSTFFTWGLNNMVHDDDTYETTFNAAQTIRNEINWRVKPYGVFMRKGYPLLSAELLPRQTFGNCLDYVTLGVLTYRSVGIPCVIDETPFWGRFRSGHSWYTILNNRGEELTSEWDISSVPGRSFFIDKRIPKVYRNTYAINRERQKYLKESAYRHPFSMCQKDVTASYFNTSDLAIPVFKDIRLAEKYVYIATFTGMNTDWSVVDYGILRRGKALFHDMGRNILYIALGYNGNDLVPISKPFILHTDGSLEYVTCDSTRTRSVEIRRKYYQSKNVAERLYRLAASMCPVRFAPLYGLFCLYEEQGRFGEMKSMGQAILNKRIKI